MVAKYYESRHLYDSNPDNREKKRVLDYIRKTVGIENVEIGDQIVNEPILSTRHIFGKTRYMLIRDGRILVSSYKGRQLKISRIGRLLKDYKFYSGRPRKTDAEKKKSKHDYNVWYYQFNTKGIIS